MKSHTSHLGIALIIAGLSIGMIAHAADPDSDGWVDHVNGRQLDICYRDTLPPAVGTRLQVMRASFVVPNKGLARERFAPAGQATVTSVIAKRCVRAGLTEGVAHRADHVRDIR
jgi:hypothetical protein